MKPYAILHPYAVRAEIETPFGPIGRGMDIYAPFTTTEFRAAMSEMIDSMISEARGRGMLLAPIDLAKTRVKQGWLL